MTVSRYEFGGLMFRFIHEHEHRIREFSSASGLYNGQPRILTTIKDNDGCTLSELSELTGVGMPSLSVSVRNMKRTGLIKSGDGRYRSRELSLTEEGLKRAEEFHKMFDKFYTEIMAHLGPERTEAFAKELISLYRLFVDYRDTNHADESEASPEC